jgi:clan AA aspartic protease
MSIRLVASPRHRQLFLNNEECMGEIRIQVKLTNGIDEANAAANLIAPEQIRSITVEAIVDTGAVRSVIPQSVIDMLGVQIRSNEIARYADGRSENVGLTFHILFEIMGRSTADEALVLGDEVLIGQTILEKLDLLADCRNRRLVANPDHPDFAVTRV